MTPFWVCTVFFIYPYFTYRVVVCGKTYIIDLDCIITLQKRVIQILVGVHLLTHTEPVFSRLKILKSIDLVDYIIGIFMYKVYHHYVPKYLNILHWERQHPWSNHQTNRLYTHCPCWYKPTQYVYVVLGRQSLETYCKVCKSMQWEHIHVLTWIHTILIELLYITMVQYFLLTLYRREYCKC